MLYCGLRSSGRWLEHMLSCAHFVLSSLGNLHLNVVGDTHSTELLNLIEPFVFDWTGTIM